MVSTDRIDFTKPIPAASLVELVGRVEKVGLTSIKIKVAVYLEKMNEDFREQVVAGSFTLVAIDKNHKPLSVE